MEFSKDEPPTPHFGNLKGNITLSKELLEKKFPKSSKVFTNYVKNNENYKKKSKGKIKKKEKSKNKSKEKSKNKNKSSNSKINVISSASLPIGHKYKNPLDIFLKKRLQLRNDFDQRNSEKFLSEKELAFQQFRMNENADYIDN